MNKIFKFYVHDENIGEDIPYEQKLKETKYIVAKDFTKEDLLKIRNSMRFRVRGDDLVIVDDPLKKYYKTNKQNIESLKAIPKRRRNMFVVHTLCREVNGVLEVLEAWSETIGGDDE